MHILETNTNCAMSQPVSPLFGVKEGALRSQVEAALLRDVYMASKAPQAWPTQAQVSASVHHPPDATFLHSHPLRRPGQLSRALEYCLPTSSSGPRAWRPFVLSCLLTRSSLCVSVSCSWPIRTPVALGQGHPMTSLYLKTSLKSVS